MIISNLWLPLILGSIFGVLAGASAYIITYQEYIRHFPDKARPRQMALRMALVAFLFFVISILVVWIIFIRLFSKG
jgi:integral membrane sensor domain MASE1